MCVCALLDGRSRGVKACGLGRGRSFMTTNKKSCVCVRVLVFVNVLIRNIKKTTTLANKLKQKQEKETKKRTKGLITILTAF